MPPCTGVGERPLIAVAPRTTISFDGKAVATTPESGLELMAAATAEATCTAVTLAGTAIKVDPGTCRPGAPISTNVLGGVVPSVTVWAGVPPSTTRPPPTLIGAVLPDILRPGTLVMAATIASAIWFAVEG